MKKIYIKIQILSALVMVSSIAFFTSCLDDLNQVPPTDKSKNDILNEDGCKSMLAKIYTGFGLTGIKGPNGDYAAGEADLEGGDQGSRAFLRGLISMQEYPSDEAIWSWKDDGVVELTTTSWNYTTLYAYTFYQRNMLTLRYCKEFLDLYTEDMNIPDVKKYRDEVRGLRDLTYFYLIDIYGNPGVVWDDSPTDDPEWKPSQMGRGPLFDRIVADLEELAVSPNLDETPAWKNYGRVTKPVIWMVLAKMYLNAEVYKGTPMYDKARQYCEKIIAAGYGLEDNYANLFCGQNDQTMSHKKEIIFALIFDKDNAKSYGNTIMLTGASYGGEAFAQQWFGSNAAWNCMKVRSSLIDKFAFVPEAGLGRLKNRIKADTRYMFSDVFSWVRKSDGSIDAPAGTDPNWPFDPVTGQILYEVDTRRDVSATLGTWDNGYLCYKYTNLGWDGAKVLPSDFPDTDFPMFRLADVYLMYAECAVRGAGDKTLALNYINSLRARAYKGTSSGQISQSDLTLQFIIDERARELYWEGWRRSDLIRFGLFTKGYAWPYKGGTDDGMADIDSKYNLYPISDKDLTSNPNLHQNPGYQNLGN